MLDDLTTLPDAELLRRHVDGDGGAAFGELFRRHRDRLWAVALRTTGDPEEAADALQDAMVSAFGKAGSYRADAAVTTWLPGARRLGTHTLTTLPPDLVAGLPEWCRATLTDLAAQRLPQVEEYRLSLFRLPGAEAGGAGTRAVLEVRSHEVPFVLEDGQRVGRLIYERLIARPDRLYGAGIGSSYQRQGLTLSKHFRLD